MGAVKPAAEKPLPKTLGACADRLYALKNDKAAAQRVVDAIDAEEKRLQAHVIDTLPKSDAEGVTGKFGHIKIVKKVVPSVKDWDKFYAYVKKNNAFELLQKRIGGKAVGERWDAGKEVPGVERFDVVTVSVTKRG